MGVAQVALLSFAVLSGFDFRTAGAAPSPGRIPRIFGTPPQADARHDGRAPPRKLDGRAPGPPPMGPPARPVATTTTTSTSSTSTSSSSTATAVALSIDLGGGGSGPPSIPAIGGHAAVPAGGTTTTSSSSSSTAVEFSIDLGSQQTTTPQLPGIGGHAAVTTTSSVSSLAISIDLGNQGGAGTTAPSIGGNAQGPPGLGKVSTGSSVQFTLDLGGESTTSAPPSTSNESPIQDLESTPTSTQTDYTYPAIDGASGTLGIESGGPTRTSDASVSTVIPNSATRAGPPPLNVQTKTTTTDQDTALANTGNINKGSTTTTGGGGGAVTGPPVIGGKTTTKSQQITWSAAVSNPGQPTEAESSSIPDSSSPTPSSSNPISSPPVSSYVVPTGTGGSGYASVPYGNSTGWYQNTTSVEYPDEHSTHHPLVTPSRTTSSTTSTTDTVSECQSTDITKAATSYSWVYSWTITWYGEPSDYVTPYPGADTTPPSCTVIKTPNKFTKSFCTSTGTGTRYMTCEDLTTVLGQNVGTVPSGSGWVSYTDYITIAPTATSTLITTAKNPAVVYTSISSPAYSSPTTTAVNVHTTAKGNPEISTPLYGNGGTTEADVVGNNDNTKTSANPPVTVGVWSDSVVINGHTVTNPASGGTTTTTIDGSAYTVDGSQVIGPSGATVDRPALVGGVFVPTPTSTNVGGIDVIVKSSVAVIGGTSFTIGTSPTTAIVDGKTVSIGPSGISVASVTIPVNVLPPPTEVVIAGGELITAIGQSVVVIHGTTITYGTGQGQSRTVIDGDTITLGPQGITVHGTTLGGLNARSSDTQYEIVGGATITEIGASTVIIGGTTYTVGPGAKPTTAVIGGETITIGPSGVVVSTYTFPFPFGPTTTITPGATAAAATAEPTNKDAGSSLRPDWSLAVILACIAIGVRVLI